MFISDNNKKALKTGFIYVLASAFCGLFAFIYELFSHEVWSFAMVFSFAIPLVMGAIPYLAIGIFGKNKPLCRPALNLHAFGVATLTVGSIFLGVLEIYGTTNSLTVIYLIAGLVFTVFSIITAIFSKKSVK
ncbi:MAG: hypothetical protein E7490_11065 [Ruminococcaceae bacterium]|nr:hypothetical protein [Oscillospiraceae bacterium]